jgi:hypothetical protein
MAKNKQQAKKMASAGKSAAQIKAKTGVSGQTAQKYVAKQPSSGGGGGGNNRQEVKEVAKQAAVSGNYNKSNTQALKEAGVKKSNIQTIKGVNRDTKAAAAGAAEARENPTYQGAGFQDALQNQVAGGGTVGQQFYDSLDAGVRGDLTSQQVADYAMSQGYGLGDQWQKDFGTKTEDAQTLKQVMKGDSKTKLGALLKIASGQGKGTDFVDNKEFRKVYKYFDGDKSGLKITDKMDKINSKQAAKDNGYNPMGLQVGTFNKINKNKYGDARDIAWNTIGNSAAMIGGKEGMSKLSKHGGALSQLAMNYKGSNIEGMKGNQGVYGADASGNAIFSPGQGGKSWLENKLNKSTELSYTPWATDVQPTGGDPPPNPNPNPVVTGTDVPVVPDDVPVDNSASSGAGGLDLSSWATSFKRARSARQKLGNSAQGLASQKKNPFIPWAK